MRNRDRTHLPFNVRTISTFFFSPLQGLHERRRDGDQENRRLRQPHGESSVIRVLQKKPFFYISFTFPHNDDSFSATETQNFYKSEVNKEDMYIRYIHKLCDLHLQAEDFTGNARRRLFSSHPQCARVTLAFIYSGTREEDGAERVQRRKP